LLTSNLLSHVVKYHLAPTSMASSQNDSPGSSTGLRASTAATVRVCPLHRVHTVRTICAAGVRPSVCRSTGPQQQTHCCKSTAVRLVHRSDRSIADRRADECAGSATLLAYVHRLANSSATRREIAVSAASNTCVDWSKACSCH